MTRNVVPFVTIPILLFPHHSTLSFLQKKTRSLESRAQPRRKRLNRCRVTRMFAVHQPDPDDQVVVTGDGNRAESELHPPADEQQGRDLEHKVEEAQPVADAQLAGPFGAANNPGGDPQQRRPGEVLNHPQPEAKTTSGR